MPISFNEIPSTINVPLFYAEFDNSRASTSGSGSSDALLFGQRLPNGTVDALEPTIVTSKENAATFFGPGSMLARMAEKYLENNGANKLVCLPFDDDGAGVAATGKVVFAGVATASGLATVYIGGRDLVYKTAITATDTAATIVTALAAAINADNVRLVDALANGNDLELTARNKGEVGNSIGVEVNFFDGEVLPAGITSTTTPMAGGAGNPDVSQAFTVLGEDQYILMACPYTDTPNIQAMEQELAGRFGPLRQNEGFAIYAMKDTLSNLSTFGDTKNSQFTTIMGYQGGLEDVSQYAAAVVGAIIGPQEADPARPFQTLVLEGITAPRKVDQFIISEKQILLSSGIATSRVSPGGQVLIERIVTTFKENQFGSPDNSYMDLNSPLTLSLIRRETKAMTESKFPRHKLGNDGEIFGAGQAILTPNVYKSELVALALSWVRRGLIEGIDQFKSDLIVERNEQNRNRLDVCMPPDLVNQFRVGAVKIQFLL